MGSPPADVTKKTVPNNLSKVNSIKATVITGKASTNKIDVISVIQTNNGMRIKLIPGARILIIVTTKLNAAANDATPRTCRLTAQ